MELSLLDLLTVVIGGGAASSIVTEILKQPFVPIAFERWPRLTAYVVSLVTTVLVIVNEGVTWAQATSNVLQLALLAAVTFIGSVVSYEKFVEDKPSSPTRF